MFEGYLSMGGNEVLNSARAYGYTRSASCPITWLQCDPCDGLREALGDNTYDTASISEAPWYDAENEVTHRFYGAHALSIENIMDSTRTAEVVEGILDGGVVGRVRNAVRQIRIRAILVAEGEDALESGLSWLKAVLDTENCGTHGNSCGQADVCFYVACPPERDTVLGYTDWVTQTTNTVLNPSAEIAVSVLSGTPYIGEWMQSSEWSVSGNYSLYVPPETDAPLLPSTTLYPSATLYPKG